jgi:hypothetical protein
MSYIEAEYIVASTGSYEEIWLKKLLLEFGVMEMSPTLVLCDNQSYIKLSNNLVFHDNSKQIETIYHYIRDLIHKDIYMEYCSTEDNVTDIFTKALPRPKLEVCRSGLGLLVPSTIFKREC